MNTFKTLSLKRVNPIRTRTSHAIWAGMFCAYRAAMPHGMGLKGVPSI